MNRKDRRAAEARSKAKATPEAGEGERMSLMMRNEDRIRRSYEAARATLGDDVIVVVADPTDPLGRVFSVNQQMSEEQVDALITSEVHDGRRPLVIGTLRRDEVLRLVESGAAVAARAVRAWSPDSRRILVMCASVGGITVSELGLGGGEGVDAKRIRADILQQSTYGIRRVRADARDTGMKEVVVIVVDVRDPTGRAVALSSGAPPAGIDAMIASAISKGGLPIFMVCKPRDEVVQSVQRSLPVVAAILKNWSPNGTDFPVICFAAGGDTVEMHQDAKAMSPLGSA